MFKYNRVSDALYVKIKKGKVHDSEEISLGVIVDFDMIGVKQLV